MPDQLARHFHYTLGNIARFVTRPWRQWAIVPEEATTIFACGYGSDGWHHLRRTLMEIDDDPEIKPQATTLWRFLKDFQPASISELVPYSGQSLPLFVYPWGTFQDGILESNKSVEKSRFCGPSQDAFIIDEFNRMKTLYAQMKKNGYRPTTFPNSFIGGTWLIRTDGQRRFVVLQGNHRMAVLAHLGYREIAVRAMSGFLATVLEKDIKEWPLVQRGLCNEHQAVAIFHLFFEESGFHIADRLEVMSKRRCYFL
jgi:hypothetical protein